jgi:hypothetical protein
VSQGQRRYAKADVNLLEVALGFEINGRGGRGTRVFFAASNGLQVTEFLFD